MFDWSDKGGRSLGGLAVWREIAGGETRRREEVNTGPHQAGRRGGRDQCRERGKKASTGNRRRCVAEEGWMSGELHLRDSGPAWGRCRLLTEGEEFCLHF